MSKTIICRGCNQSFIARKGAKTCSAKCRKRLQRAMQVVSSETKALHQAKQVLAREAAALKESAEHTLKSAEKTFKGLESAASKEISPEIATEGGFISGDPEVAPANTTPKAPSPVSTNILQKTPNTFPGATIIQPVQTPEKQLHPQAITDNIPSEYVSLKESSIEEPALPITDGDIEQGSNAPTTITNEPPSPPLNPPPTQTQPFQEEIPKRPSFGFNLRRWAVLVTSLVLLVGGSLVVLLQPKQQNNPQTQISINAQSLSSIANAPLEGQSNAGTLNINRDSIIALGKSLTTTGQVVFQNSAGDNLLIADSTNSKIGINTTPTGAASLQVVGDIQTSETLIANNGTSSLNNDGLKINGVVVCTAAGCNSTTDFPTNVTVQGNSFNGSGQLVMLNGFGYLPALNGSNLVSVNAITLQGNSSTYFTNASNISSGTLNDARLSTNVTLQGNTFNGVSQLVQTTVTGALPVISGVNLTNLDAANISIGTLTDDRLSSNVPLKNANNIFTGTNIFQNTATNAFQIHNAAGNSNLLIADTTNTRIAIGQASANYTLDVNGDINTTGAFRVDGSVVCNELGCLAAGGSGNYIQNGTTLQVANFYIQSASAASIGAIIQGDVAQSADLQQWRASDNTPLSVVDAAGNFGINTTNLAGYNLNVNGTANATALLQGGNAVCDTSGNCIGGAGGMIGGSGTTGTLAVFTDAGVTIGNSNLSQVGTTTTATGTFNATTALQTNGTNRIDATGNLVNIGSITGAGDLIVKPGVDSVTAFQIQNAAGAGNLFIADTTNSRIAIGKTAPDYTLDVAGDINVTGAYRINGIAICTSSGCTPVGGSNEYIQLQGITPGTQQTGHFNISGTGILGLLSVSGTGKTAISLTDTTTTTGITIGGDTNLYRSAANTLQTDDDLLVGGSLGLGGYSVNPTYSINAPKGAYFGSATLVNGDLTAARFIDYANSSYYLDPHNTGTSLTLAGSVAIGDTSPDFNLDVAGNIRLQGSNALFFGGTGAADNDTNLYRSAANTLKTDDNFLIQTATDSTTAFQVQNADGDALFNVDTSGSNITLNGLNSGELSTWSTNANALPATRYYHTSVVANGYVYVIGSGATVYYAKLNADGSTGAWSTNASALPAVRGSHSSVVANGYVYVIGGNGASTVYYAKLNADGSTGTWSTNANALPAVRGSHSSVVANGYVYVIGGYDTDYRSTVYYAKLNADGSTGAWSTNANALPAVRRYHSSVVANGYVYAIGGFTGSSQSTVYYAKLNADGSTGAWSTNANALPAIRDSHTSVVANGYVYVIGGAEGTTAQSTVYYAKLNADGSTGAWSTNANALPAARQAHTSVIANGYIYAIGGLEASTPQSTVYYASTSRILMAGSLDLVGLSGQNLSEDGDFSQGSMGGSLVAGNTSIIGSFNVQGQAAFSQGMSIDKELRVGGSALFKNTTNSTTAFQVQDAAGSAALSVDTTDVGGYASVNIGGGAYTASQVQFFQGATEYWDIGTDDTGLGGNNGLFISYNPTSDYVFGLSTAGAATFRNITDSTAAFQIQDAAGTSNLFIADTTNTKVGIAMAPSSTGATAQIAGDVSATTGLVLAATGNSSSTISKSMIVSTAVNANDVVIIDTANAGQVKTTNVAGSSKVFGIATTTNASPGQAQNIVIGGIYEVTADTSAVSIGDLLITSPTATGQVAASSGNATGSIIGRALSSKAAGSSGLVWVQVAPGANSGDSPTAIGTITPYAGLTIPAGWLAADGSSVSRASYPSLFSTLVTSKGTATISNGSPSVVTLNGHGLLNGDHVFFTTTGALPTGLSANTTYCVRNKATNTFELAAYAQSTQSCSGSSINTSSAGSGVHTLYLAPYGVPDASNFYLPDLRGRTAIGVGTNGYNDTLGDNENVAESSRSPKHNSTVTDPGHSHQEIFGWGAGSTYLAPMNLTQAPYGVPTHTNTSTTGITIGPGGSLPTDTGAYITTQYIIKASSATGSGTGDATTLQGAYDMGASITTTNARDINFTLANTATDSNYIINIASGSTGKFELQGAGTNTLTVDSTGQTLFKNTADSTTAFQIQPAASATPVFNVDTTNNRIGIGTDTPETQLHIFAASTGEVNLITLETTPNDYDQGAGILFKDDGYNSAQIHSVGYDYGVAGLAFNVTPTPGSLTEGMRLDSDGNLGIGTTDPSAMLHVAGNALFKNTADSTTAFQIQNAAGTSNLFVADTVNGRIGIGTASPDQKLTVNGIIGLQSSGTTKYHTGYFIDRFTITETGVSERLVIKDGGNVGIGTTSPGAKLEVELDSTSTAPFSGGLDQNTALRLRNNGATTLNQYTNLAFYTGGTNYVGSVIQDQLVSTGGTGKHNLNFYTNNNAGWTGFSDAAMTIHYTGNVGIGTIGPESKLQVSGGGLCVGTDANCNTDNNVEGRVYSSSTAMTVYDVAENYPTTDETIAPEEIVALDPDRGVFVKRATGAANEVPLGVISADPAVHLGGFNGAQFKEHHQVAVGLSGRIPVKVTSEGGDIKIGDPLTASSIPGAAKKATQSGYIIGRALENYDSDNPQEIGSIQFFINLSWFNATSTDQLQGGNPVVDGMIINGNLEADTLTVDGSAQFKGNVTIAGSTTIQGNLVLAAHIITDGNTPTLAAEAAAGDGATAEIDGNDTSGTITIHTGSSPTAGDLVTMNFAKVYDTKPRVIISGQDGHSAASLMYPTEKSTNGFKLHMGSAPNANTTYTFDYFIVQ